MSSLGADGKPGGTGPNADLVRRYRTRKPDGSLNVDDPAWIFNAEIEEGVHEAVATPSGAADRAVKAPIPRLEADLAGPETSEAEINSRKQAR